MQTSARRGISSPSLDRSDRPDIPAHFKNLVDALEVDVSYGTGSFAARPANPGYAGFIYFTTDTHLAYWWDGSSWYGIGTADVIPQTLIDAKGDLIVGLADNQAARLPVGANNYHLTADNTVPAGVKWAMNAAIDLIAAKGDLLVGTAVDTLARIGVGADGQSLVADSAQAAGIKWSSPVLSYVVGVLGANQSMTNQMQFYDGASVSCVAGTWVLVGSHIHVITGSNPVVYSKLHDGVSTPINTAWQEGSSVMRQIINMGVVTLGSTTTYKVSLAGNSGGANGGTITASTGQPAGNLAGILIGLRIA